MNLRTLDAYGVKNGIKHGLTIEDFCTKYGCTPRELQIHLEKNLYGNNKQEVKARMVEMNLNAKKARPKKKQLEVKEEANGETTVVVRDAEATVADDDSTDTTDVGTDTIGTSTDVASIDDPADALDDIKSIENMINYRMDKLAQVKAEETTQGKEVICLEETLKDSHELRREGLKELRSVRNEIEQTKATFEELCAKFEAKAERINTIAEQINGINLKLREKRVALEETREKIEELETLNILVYGNCDLAVDDKKVVIPTDEDADALYYDIREKPECEELRIKEIRLLAKLLIVTRNSALEVELICDNEELEKAYFKLK